MATSPIYSWPEPDNTDLVKNGALAIRTLGNAIDTTMGTMVAKTVVDAKGDLIAGTAADTVNRLAVGSNGESLVADSSTSTGLRYQADYAAGKNAIINGAFNVWQRGTSVSLTSNTYAYGPDRFVALCTFSAGTSSFSQQSFAAGTAPVAGYEGTFFARVTCGTTSSNLLIDQRIEDVRVFAGQTVTFSFYAKASGSMVFTPTFNQVFGSGGSATVNTAGSNVTLTTSWARYTTTITLPSISGKTIGTNSYLNASMVYSSGSLNTATLDVWGWQVEAGSVATAFQTATGNLQTEITACERYFQKKNTSPIRQYNNTGALSNQYCLLGNSMRATPTTTITTAPGYNNASNFTVQAFDNTSLSIGLTITTLGTGFVDQTGIYTLAAEL